MNADSTTSWLAIVVMILHWLGPVLNKLVDALIAKYLQPKKQDA